MKYWLLSIILLSTFVKSEVHFHSLNVTNGLSQNSVLSICQDSIGYLWFGTQANGLNKYDGKNFTHFNFFDDVSNSISSNSIKKLLADSNGDIWIGTTNGLDFYNAAKKEFTKALYYDKSEILYSFSSLNITSLKKDGSGVIWVVASKKVFYKDPGENIFREGSTLNHIPITDIEPINNELLIASGNKLYHYNKINQSIVASNLIDDRFLTINCLFRDSNDNIFIGSNFEGFAFYSKSEDSTYYFSPEQFSEMKSGIIRTFCEDSKNNVYIGSFNGLYSLNTKTLKLETYYSNEGQINSLSHNSIYDIVQDNAKNIWIGTYSGGISVKYATQYNFITYSRNANNNKSLQSNIINTFFEDDYGIWLGTDGEGLALMNEEGFQHFRSLENIPSSISNRYVKTILKHDKEHIWVGGHQSGIDLFNQETHAVKGHYFAELPIYSLARDNDSILWLASPGNGILLFDEKTFKPIANEDSPYKSISAEKTKIAKFVLHSDKHNIMWICTTTGLYFFDFRSNQFKNVNNFDSYQNSFDNIRHLYEDKKGNTWIATTYGLLKISKLNTNNGYCQIEEFNTSNLLPSNNIMAVTGDSLDNIWISTINSIVKINHKLSCTNTYDYKHNIQSNDFTKAAGFKSRDGRLWFGGNGGFTVFDPTKIANNNFIPPSALTELYINDQIIQPNDQTNILQQDIAYTSKLILKHWQNNIKLNVAAFNYIMSQNNQYKWQFKDKRRTIITGKTSNISVNNLSPGKYSLLAYTSNNDNIWNPNPLRLNIIIRPPWYKTNLAFTLYLLVFIGIWILAWKIIKGHNRILNKLELEKLQKNKNKKIHDQKVQFFTNLSHEFRTPLSLISGPLDLAIKEAISPSVKNHLNVAIRNTNYLRELLDELMDFRKIEGGKRKIKVSEINIYDFLKSITDLSDKSLSYYNTPILFNSSLNESVYFDPVILKKIVLNLLYNAFKYNKDKQKININLTENHIKSNNTNIFTFGNAISKNEKYIVISIKDNGIGISPEDFPFIFDDFFQVSDSSQDHSGYGLGLSFVKKLILLHKGELYAESTVGKGSVFSIKIPVGIDDYNETERLNSKYELTSEIPFERKENIPLQKSNSKKEHTVLLVEDNEELQAWMNLFLSQKYKCIVASNGQEGINIALKRNPDLIISDVMMPVVDGYELCQTLKTNLKTSHIPILLLTAKKSREAKKDGINSGADAYISKPFDSEILLAQIDNFLSLRAKIIERYNNNTEDNNQSFIDSLSVLDRKLFDSIHSFINDNLSNPNINVDDMANKLFMSRSSLYRKIKSLTNSTPNEFIKDFRLKKAQELINEKKMTVNEISEAVGFQDVYYFKKCFAVKFGIKPE
ncbi:response regulator [Labilibacter sediminis]|nr:response regulator [Labilibacter sediminis]